MMTPFNNPRREATMRQNTLCQPTQSTTRSSYPYKEIHALMLYWEEDDLGCGEETHCLKEVFERKFHFTTVQHVVIPSSQLYGFVESTLCEFKRKHSCKDNLLLVYYAGHGGLDAFGRMTWCAYGKPKSRGVGVPEVEWYALQLGLERAVSDVVILLDSCAAADSISSPSTYSKEGGTSELIGACGYDTMAPGPGIKSFSHALIEELEAFAVKRGIFSVVDLHQRVLANVLRQNWEQAQWQPDPDLEGLDDFRQLERATTPVFVRLNGDSREPSIALKVLPKKSEPVLQGGTALEEAMGNMTLNNWAQRWEDSKVYRDMIKRTDGEGRQTPTSNFSA
ncbi:hypothetical protein BDZ45DRAFT_699495 [Acephala macrosclerotiorum]|nr:hypothetical protein BDZ45DRAFT_699495 [Acephala macrosclerotiorum]